MNTQEMLNRASRYPAWLAVAMMAPLTGLAALVMLAAAFGFQPGLQQFWPQLTGKCGTHLAEAASSQVAQAALQVQQATYVLNHFDGDVTTAGMMAQSQRAAARAQRALLRALRHAA